MNLKPRFDYPLFIVTIILMAIGIVMVFSASWPFSLQVHGVPYVEFRKHLIFAIIALIVMMISSQVPYQWYKKFAIVIFAIGFLTSLLVYTPLGLTLNSARRWIEIGSYTFMPSDLLKMTGVVMLARLFAQNPTQIRTYRYGVRPFLIVLAFVAVPVYLQPDLSTTFAIFLSLLVMYIVMGMNLRLLWPIGMLGIGGLFFSILFTNSEYSRLDRIKSFLNPMADLQNTGWQLAQSLYAVTTGSLFGLGLGKSRQKYLYLSEAHNDFIYAIICEEFGFVGAVLVLGLYLFLLFRGVVIAGQTKDPFAKMLCTGFIAIIGIQALINITVVVGLTPPTGIVLPFISYGGSSLIIFSWMIGIILNISKQNCMKERN